jgi:hypothetical protein
MKASAEGAFEFKELRRRNVEQLRGQALPFVGGELVEKRDRLRIENG